MTLSGGELSYLRDGHPHKTRMFLSVLKPQIVYVGQVTGSPDRAARVITVANVSGAIGDIIVGMTVLIGTASGFDDVHDGRRRYRSRSGQDLTLDENNVEWVNGQYVTVIENWELWPVFPYIALEKPYTFYKDYDIEYNPSSGQNDEIDPVAQIAGNHMVGFLDGPTITFDLDATGSHTMSLGSTITDYAWSCTGGAIANAAVSTTTITFDTANKNGYWLTLTITDSEGKTHTTRRVIFVHTRTGTHAPHYDLLVVDSPTGNWREGGWRTKIEVRDDADIANYPDKSLCILWSKDYYNGTEVEIGDDANVKMIGYIRGDTIKTTTGADNRVSFVITTIEDLMKRHKMFSVSLEYKENDRKWYHFNANGRGLTVAGAVHHLWHWHSTLLGITNVYLPMSNVVKILAVDDFINGNLYSLAEGFAMQHGIFAHVCCNKIGEVHLEIDINMLSDSQRDAKEIMMEVTKVDRRGDPLLDIVRETERTVAYGTVSGVSFDGSDASPVISIGPGDVPYVDGDGELSLERQVLTGQDDGNVKIGRALAIVNNPFKLFPIMFAGNYGFIDIVPQKWYTISIAAEDTKRGIVLTDYKLIPRTVVNRFDPGTGTIMTDVVFDTDADGQDGIPGNYPEDLTEIPPPVIPTAMGGGIVSFDRVNGAHHRSSWTERNGDLTGADIQDNWGDKDPWWFTGDKQASLDPTKVIMWKCDTGKIFRTTDQGVNWTDMTPSTGPPGYSPSSFDYIQYEGNNFWNYEHIFIARQGGGVGVSYFLHTDDDGVTWNWYLIQTPAATGPTIPVEATAWNVTQNEPGMDSGGLGWDGWKMSPYHGLVMLTETKGIMLGISCGETSPYHTDIVAFVITVDGNGEISSVTGPTVIQTNEDEGQTTQTAAIARLDDTRFGVGFIDFWSLGEEPWTYWFEPALIIGELLGDGVTISVGIEVILMLETHVQTVDLIALDEDTLVYTCKSDVGDPDYDVMAIMCSVTGTIPTNIGVNYLGDSGRKYWGVKANPLSSTHFMIHMTEYDGGSDNRHGWSVGCEHTGSGLVTFGTPVMFHELTGGNYMILQQEGIRLTDTKWVINYAYWPRIALPVYYFAMVGTIDPDTLDITYFPGNRQSSNYGKIVPLSATSYGQIYNVGDYPAVRINTVSGYAITIGTETEYMVEFPAKDMAMDWQPFMDVTPGGVFVVGHSDIDWEGDWGVSGICGSRETFNKAWTWYEPAGTPNKVIGMSIDKANGNYIHITACDNVNLIYKVYSLPSFALFNEVNIGGCSIAELDARTWFAFPESDTFGSLSCVVYGKMDNPLGGGTVHVMSTGSAGAAWTVQEAGWGGDYCSALHVDRPGYLNAIRRKGTGSEYHRGLTSLSKILDIVLHINPGAIKVTVDGYVILGGEAVVGGQMLLWSPYPFASWNDFTEDHPTDGEITSLILI